MSDSEEGAGVSKPLIEEIEDDKNYSVEQFELDENGEERVEKEENVLLADLLPETTETSDFLEGGPQKRQVKLTERERLMRSKNSAKNVKTPTRPYQSRSRKFVNHWMITLV